MKIFVYDFEVFAFDWFIVLMNMDNEQFTVIHNDADALREFMEEHTKAIFIGFNTKNYDQHIMRAICGGNASPEECKELNDWIIVGGHQGWDHHLIQGNWFRFNNCDIMDDMQVGQSLKSIEGHLGRNIVESDVDFTINRKLTVEEQAETIKYCTEDVKATAEIVKLRKKYLQTKMDIGRMVGLDDAKSLSMTNAKLTAAFLKAQQPSKPWTDERDYKIPDNLKREYIPQEVFDFFDKLKDRSIPDDVVFKSKLQIKLGDCPVTIAYGGAHACIPNLMWEEDSDAELHHERQVMRK